MRDEEWQNSLRRGDPWMSQKPDCAGVAQIQEKVTNKPLDLVDVEQDAGSGGISTDLAREPSLALPRLIPVPNPPSMQPPPVPSVGDEGPASASFERKCAPSQAPVTDTTNYEQLSYGQSHELCKQRGYHKKDTIVSNAVQAGAAYSTGGHGRSKQETCGEELARNGYVNVSSGLGNPNCGGGHGYGGSSGREY